MGKEQVKALFEAYARGEGFAEVYLIGDKLVVGTSQEISYKLMIELDTEHLIADAKTDHETFELVLKGAAFAIREKLHLPREISLFIADYLMNEKIRPKRTGGTKEDFDFNWTVRLAMRELIKAGIKPTRNEGTPEENVKCGIDIIREVLEDLGVTRSRSYDSLRKLWERTEDKYL